MQRLKLHKFIKRYTSITCAIDMLRRKELTLLDPQNWDDRNDRYFMALYKEHIKRKNMYAVCFTQSKETYHQWRVFTSDDSGACIKNHKPAFVEMLKGTPDF